MKRRNMLAAIAAIFALPLMRGVGSAFAAEVPAVRDGQGLVVFYRPRRAKGGGLRYIISGGGQTVGNLTNGTVIAHPVEPGQHLFEVNSASLDGRDVVSITVAPGQVQFVKATFVLGWPTWRGQFLLVAEKVGRSEVAKM